VYYALVEFNEKEIIVKHPIQPLSVDKEGVLRFKENKIIRYLLDKGGVSLNDLAVLNFSDNDREQLSQLIGYSLSGFGDLSHVSDETYHAAENTYKDVKTTELQERYNEATNQLAVLKDSMKDVCAKLFNIHPDDLN